MESVKHRFRDLNTVVDDARDAIDASTTSWIGRGVESDVIEVAKLVAHEWIANLVRHASFGGRIPDIALDVWTEGNLIRTVVEDNSDGFDLDAELDLARRELGRAPERGMGLIMVKEFTSDLNYMHVSKILHRVSWTISINDNPHLDLQV
jgi:anti-sigma regulatory factor (Ser/Thr protein kinase)